MSSSPSTSSKTLYRTLLIESDDVSHDSLSPLLVSARFLVERCSTPAQAVTLFRGHDLVLIRAIYGTSTENLRRLVSWLRHNSAEGAEPFAMIVASQSMLKQLDGLPCDMVDERFIKSKLVAHLEEVRGYLDTTRKHGEASFWSRLFGRSPAPEERAAIVENPQVTEKSKLNGVPQKMNGTPQKIVETKTGQHINSPKTEPVIEMKMPVADGPVVMPLVPREKVAALKMAPREVIPFRRPLEISSITPILLKEISEAAALLGQDYRVIEANDAWLKLFSTDKESVLGSAGVEFNTGFDKVAWANILHRALLGREFDADQELLDSPIGTLKVRPVPGHDGTPMGVLVLCTSKNSGELKLPQSDEKSAEVEARIRVELETDIGRQKLRINEMSNELMELRQKIQLAESKAQSAQDELDKEREAASAAHRKHELQRVRFDELVDALATARSMGSPPNTETASMLEKMSAPKIDLGLLDYAPFGIVRLSSDGEVIFANTQVDQLMGFSIARGQTFADWIAKGRASEEMSAALVGEWTDKVWRRQMTSVVQVAGDDGLLKDVEFRPTLMDDGGLLVFVSDVTDRQQVYQALRSAETKFRGMFRSAVAGVALMDSDGAIYDANVKFCEMFARNRGDVCSTTLLALVQGSICDQSSGDLLQNPIRFTLPSGEDAVLACSALSMGEDEARAIYCIAVPGSEMKQSTVSDGFAREGMQTMVALADEWRQLSEGQGDNALPDVLMRWLDVLSATIIPDRQNEVDIARVARDLIAETRHRMSVEGRKNIIFDAPVDERFIPSKMAVPLALAISELMQNAIQHGLKNGAIEGLVRVHFTCNEDEIIAEICDTGSELRRNFEFEKHARDGLKLARLLVMRVGGKLSIDSGTETRCQMNIPLK